MFIDDAIHKMTDLIKGACSSAEIEDATFQPAIDMLNSGGVDVQVFVSDKDAPSLKS